MDKDTSLIGDIERNRFLLILLNEEMYMDKIAKIAESMGKDKKICYVCLSKPYKDVCDELKKNGIETKRFYFIDALSSHYRKMRPAGNCTFLTSPTNLLEIKFAISKAVKEKKCDAVVFDTISTMLIYQQSSKIVKFTHEFLSEGTEKSKILYLVLKHESIPTEENERLIKDLNLFADKTIDMERK